MVNTRILGYVPGVPGAVGAYPVDAGGEPGGVELGKDVLCLGISVFAWRFGGGELDLGAQVYLVLRGHGCRKGGKKKIAGRFPRSFCLLECCWWPALDAEWIASCISG